MGLGDLLALICYGQNIEIRDRDTEKIYFKGLIDKFKQSFIDYYIYHLASKEISMVCSSNDCDHDDYLIIEVF